MSSHNEDEWTILDTATSSQIDMEQANSAALNKEDIAARDCSIKTKPEEKPAGECTCETKHTLLRRDSTESIDEDYRRPRRSERVLPRIHRRYTPSPNRYFSPPLPVPSMINSSTQLLERVGKDDGIAELPFPAIRTVYLTTYPFGDKDIKKWSWLFAAGIEDEFVVQSTRDMAGGLPSVERVRQRNDGFVPYEPERIDIPSVYLSRALDTAVVPEDTEHDVRYLIVTQKRLQPTGAKLVVVESRKAAGMLIYYTILTGDPILFVGATVHECKAVHPRNYRKVNSLDDVLNVRDDGFVGVVC
ncbi:hypothetical protein E8E12_005804 [Didymella heteroderae]|uniref:Uncharacterized protein n=1 Tax=Didymella heteroderae TaxID=1769908 RepID=A0A9P4WPY5_9PLEO|nr:hypothetical protein E8E12_005804 [Didymella heteroderae]